MLLYLLACQPDAPSPDEAAPIDVSARLNPGEVRAGTAADAAALFGGVSAEGKAGDVKLYNDRVQFVIQAVGDSGYYDEHGGALVDADLVRDEGVPGRDVLDELMTMPGFGRVVDVETVEVLSDGTDGVARVRTSGTATPMSLIVGAFESDGAIEDLDLRVVTEYALEPDSWSLTATTTVTNDESDAVEIAIGDAAFYAQDVAEPWKPGEGRDPNGIAAVPWTAVVGNRNEVALALLQQDEPLEIGAAGAVLAELGSLMTGSAPSVEIAPGESATWTRRLGVGPDPATLSGEAVVRAGMGGQKLAGVVSAGGAPVAGARVHVLDEAGDPITLAFADAEGRWSATVPTGKVSLVASGRGHARVFDLPAGHGWAAPYAPEDDGLLLRSLADGAPGAPFAEGYGLGAPSRSWDLELVPPGVVRVRIADAGPGVARVAFAAGDAVVPDERLVPGRPEGHAAIGFVRDGELDLPLEPGSYVVTVSRGIRDHATTATVTVASGETVELDADLSPAYTLDGVVTGDPHTHASPSGDGGISMEERLLTMAAFGVDVHFGTDHDHVADYRPLLAPLGLEDRLRSVVADEVSPVLRGHFNTWPAALDAAKPNHGAPRWWLGYQDTAEIFGWMRALVGEDGVVQANHPVGDSGMFTHAGYEPGVGEVDATHWSDDFQAMELMNSGSYADYLPYYQDLVARGVHVAPVGTSDAHGATSGGLGASLTFFLTGTDFAGTTDADLVDAVRRRATVVSRGPFIDARIDGVPAPGAEVAGPVGLDVTVYAPDWMPIDTVTLLEDGVAVATEACTGTAPTPCVASWLLSPSADAAYTVVAEGATGMGAVQPGTLPWAMTAATFVDADGDGWEAPLPPLVAR